MIGLFKRVLSLLLVMGQLLSPQMAYAYQRVSLENSRFGDMEEGGRTHRIRYVPLEQAGGKESYKLHLSQDLQGLQEQETVFFYGETARRMLGAFSRNASGFLLQWAATPLALKLFAQSSVPLVIDSAGDVMLTRTPPLNYPLGIQSQNCLLGNLQCPQLSVKALQSLTTEGELISEAASLSSPKGQNDGHIGVKNALLLSGSWLHKRGKIEAGSLLAKGRLFSTRQGADIEVGDHFGAEVDTYVCDGVVQARSHQVTSQRAQLLDHYGFFGRHFGIDSTSLHMKNTSKAEVNRSIQFRASKALDVSGQYMVKANRVPVEPNEFRGFLAQSREGRVCFGAPDTHPGRASLELGQGQAILQGHEGYVYGQMRRTGRKALPLIVEAQTKAFIHSTTLLDDLYVHGDNQYIEKLPLRLGTLHMTGKNLSISPSPDVTRVHNLEISQELDAVLNRCFSVKHKTVIQAKALWVDAPQNFGGTFRARTEKTTELSASCKIEEGRIEAGNQFSATETLFGNSLTIVAPRKDLTLCPSLVRLQTQGDSLSIGTRFGTDEGAERGHVETLIAHEKTSISLGRTSIGTAHLSAESCTLFPRTTITRLKANVGSLYGEDLTTQVADITALRDVMLSQMRGHTLNILAGGSCRLWNVEGNAVHVTAGSASIDGAKTGEIVLQATQGDATLHGAVTGSAKVMAADHALASQVKADDALTVIGGSASAFESGAGTTHVATQVGGVHVSGHRGGPLRVGATEAVQVRDSGTASLHITSGGVVSVSHVESQGPVSVKARDSAALYETRAPDLTVTACDVTAENVAAQTQSLQGRESVVILGEAQGEIGARTKYLGAHGNLKGSLDVVSHSAIITQDNPGSLRAHVAESLILTGKAEEADIRADTNIGILTQPTHFKGNFETVLRLQTLLPQTPHASLDITQTGTIPLRFSGEVTTRGDTAITTNGDIEAPGAQFIFEKSLSLSGRNLDFSKASFRGEGPLTRKAREADYSGSKTNVREGISDFTEQTARYDHAVLHSDGPIHLFTNQGDLILQVADVRGGDVYLKSLLGNVRISSQTQRHGGGDNFTDVLERANLCARGLLSIYGHKSVVFEGVNTESVIGTLIESLGSIYDVPVALVTQRVNHYKRGYDKNIWVHQAVSHHQSQGPCVLSTEERTDLHAPTYRTNGLQISADQGTHLHAVHDSQTSESHSSSRTWYGGRRENHSASQTNTARGATITSQKPARFASAHGDVVLEAIRSTAPRNIIHAMEGLAILRQGENSHSSATLTTRSNVAWQSQTVHQEQHHTFQPIQAPGGFEIHSKGVMVQQVAGQTLDFLKDFESLCAPITYETLYEHHDIFHQTQSGPTEALAAVVALAVTLATYGTASSLAAGLVSAMSLTGTTGMALSTATTAAMTTVASQAAIALLNSRGNIIEAAKALGKTESLRALGLSTLTAGATAGLGSSLGVSATGTGFSDNLARTAVQTGVSTGLMVAEGQEGGACLERGLINALSTAAGGYAANRIGATYHRGQMGYLPHKLTHAALGATMGAAIGAGSGQNSGASALAGALGGMGAEMMAEALPQTWDPQIRGNAAILGLSGLSLGLGLDVPITSLTATNAVENNLLFVPALIAEAVAAATPYVLGGLAVSEGVILADAALEGGPEAALAIVQEQAALTMATGGAGTAVRLPSQVGKAIGNLSKRGASALTHAPQTLLKGVQKSRPSDGWTRNVRDYARDMELRTGIPISSEQRLLLRNALQQQSFNKLGLEEASAHSSQYTRKVCEQLKREWSLNTGREWPMSNVPITGDIDVRSAQVHHLIPQRVGGPHEWWNIHPVFQEVHQGGVHGKNAPLTHIIRNLQQ